MGPFPILNILDCFVNGPGNKASLYVGLESLNFTK